jgi:hypothetical protein
MDMNVLPALIGGVLLGAGAATLVLCNGRIAGISGIGANVLRGFVGEDGWRAAFLAGLLVPALIAGLDAPVIESSLPWLAASGLLIGFGSQVGSGCTSGHGVCGLANLSLRSLLSTATFMATAMLAVYFIRHGAGR